MFRGALYTDYQSFQSIFNLKDDKESEYSNQNIKQ